MIALGLMLIGIALLGVITAAIATWFVERLQAVEEGLTEAGEQTGATLDEIALELHEIRARLDTLDLPARVLSLPTAALEAETPVPKPPPKPRMEATRA